MISHARTKLILSQALERELAPQEEYEVNAHLEDCAGCRADRDMLVETDRLLSATLKRMRGGMPVVRLSGWQLERRRRLRHAQQATRLALTSLAVIAAVLGFLFFNMGGTGFNANRVMAATPMRLMTVTPLPSATPLPWR
jgi:predicted anti-sigma-YlaC factor YlaD